MRRPSPGAPAAEHGHEVQLMPGQAVKPFRGAMKNDAADALAITEAVHRHSNKVTVALANKLPPHLLGGARQEGGLPRAAGLIPPALPASQRWREPAEGASPAWKTNRPPRPLGLRGPTRAHLHHGQGSTPPQPQAGYIRAEPIASRLALAQRGRTIHSFGIRGCRAPLPARIELAAGGRCDQPLPPGPSLPDDRRRLDTRPARASVNA